MRALLRRAELYEQTEKLDEALEDYKKVLERDPNQAGARHACMVSRSPDGPMGSTVMFPGSFRRKQTVLKVSACLLNQEQQDIYEFMSLTVMSLPVLIN